jgi:hypothetical protein
MEEERDEPQVFDYGPELVYCGSVEDQSQLNLLDGDQRFLSLDRNNAAVARQLGGRYFAAAQRGNLFVSSNLIAGVTIPIPPVTTVFTSTAGIINPTGSSVLVEVVAMGISTVTTPDSNKPFLQGYMYGYSRFGATGSETNNITGAKVSGVTSVTTLPSFGFPLSINPRTPQAFAYSSAVFNTGTVSTDKYGVLSNLTPIMDEYASSIGYRHTYYKLDGEMTLGPDTAAAIIHTTATGLANVNVTYIWAEWPL